MKIKYYDGKTRIEIEVTEKVALGYKELCKYEDKINKRENRHKAIPIEQIEDKCGFQLINLSVPDILEQILDRERKIEEHSMLMLGWDSLKEKERKLIVDVIIRKKPIKDIAAVLGVRYQSVQDRINVILKKLKIFFDK